MATVDNVAHAIEVRDVTKRFGKTYDAVVAVEDISFSVGQNEFVSIVGPSGCGKSTMLRLIADLLPPSSGVDQGGRPERSGSQAEPGHRRGLPEPRAVCMAFGSTKRRASPGGDEPQPGRASSPRYGDAGVGRPRRLCPQEPLAALGWYAAAGVDRPCPLVQPRYLADGRALRCSGTRSRENV